MSVKDIVPIRVSFSEMHLALARGDVEAYVGAEPGPGVSISSEVGKLVEYPYSTSMGSLNMVFGAHRDTLAEKPDLTKVILEIHRKACRTRHGKSGRDGRDGGLKARPEEGSDRSIGA